MSADTTTEVVVTGLGATTPLGGDVASTWAAMLAGKSGVRRLADDWADELPVRIAGPAAVEPAASIPKAQLRRMDRSEQFAVIAAREAWRDAGAPELPADRLGVSMSTGIGGLSSTLEAYDTLRQRGWERVSPFTVPKLMPNGPAAWVSIDLGARAGAHATASACASSADAIGYGIQMIRSGRADVVVAGGAEAPIMALTIAGFAVMKALSARNDEPERASRPFDKSRDGFVLAEGGAALVLESAEHAARRGAAVYAVAAGVGYSADGFNLTQPSPDGAGPALAIQRALSQAGAAPDQVVHVNAHATSTTAGDEAETRAIGQVLGRGARDAIVTSTKSMTGHLLGAAGALESIAAICALRDCAAPPTINLDQPDDVVETAELDIATEVRKLRTGTEPAVALNNSFGFGGHNVALAFMTA